MQNTNILKFLILHFKSSENSGKGVASSKVFGLLGSFRENGTKHPKSWGWVHTEIILKTSIPYFTFNEVSLKLRDNLKDD